MSVEDYVAARNKYDADLKRVKEIAVTISNVGKILTDSPENFAFRGTSVPSSTKAGLGGATPVDASEWYSAEDLMRLVNELVQKKTVVESIWNQLSPDVRKLVIPPHGYQRF